MKLKQFFAVLLSLCIVSCLVLLGAAAEEVEIVESGTCGDNLTWTLDSEGTMTISGEGAVCKVSGESLCGDNVIHLVFESGITCIGGDTYDATPFYGWESLQSVELPDTLRDIGVSAFQECTALKQITIPAAVESIGDGAFDRCTGLEVIYFKGDAPRLYLDSYIPSEFVGMYHPNLCMGVTATAYYPAENETWTESRMEALSDGANITWVPYELDKDYEILDGTDNAWTSGSKDSLVVHADAEMSKLGAVKVDGETVDPVNYTVTEGSTIVTLSADYLSTLAVGEHTITLVFTDGTAETTFTVEAAQPEETEPETTIPEGTEPETTVPEESQPETTVPGETEPETTAPDDTKPGVTTDTGSEDSNPATGGNDMLYPVMLLVILSTAGLCLMTILVRRNRR